MANKTINYLSSLSKILAGYVEEKRAVGYEYKTEASSLKRLDKLLIQENIKEKILTKEIVLLWTKKKKSETDRTRNIRISIIKGLAQYMLKLGYNAYIYPERAVSIDRFHYAPYIFSKIEIAKIFTASDNLPSCTVSPNRHLILPLIFRILYACGLRTSEALNLKRTDVNLKDGTLFIWQAKFNKERIVPMDESLTKRCRKYSKQVHNDNIKNPYFFPSPTGGKYSRKTIYSYFRKLIWEARISHRGRGKGPRVHDFRHTYSVHCLKKWVLNGNDLTVLLPYLSSYLGHVDLRSSQYYLRLTVDLYPNIIEKVEKKFSNLIPEVDSYETN